MELVMANHIPSEDELLHRFTSAFEVINTVDQYNINAQDCLARKNLPHTLVWARKALELAEARLGSDHRNTAVSLNNVGIILAMLGDIDGAEENMLEDYHFICDENTEVRVNVQ